jgi:hypothetical protein
VWIGEAPQFCGQSGATEIEYLLKDGNPIHSQCLPFIKLYCMYSKAFADQTPGTRPKPDFWQNRDLEMSIQIGNYIASWRILANQDNNVRVFAGCHSLNIMGKQSVKCFAIRMALEKALQLQLGFSQVQIFMENKELEGSVQWKETGTLENTGDHE